MDAVTRNREAVKWLPLVWRIANAYWRGSGWRLGTADDCFQVGVMGLLRAIELYRSSHGASFKTYAHRAILSRMQNEVSYRRSWQAEPLNRPLYSPVYDHDRRMDVADMLDRLTARERKVLRLYYWEAKTLRQIGDVIGTSAVTAGTVRLAALKKLQGTVIFAA